MYYSSASFIGWVWLKGKSHKTFDIIMFTKLCFFLISIFGGGGGATAYKQTPPANGCSAFIFIGSS